MNAAVIFAGGTGKRMRSGATPKQFLELHGKPIIIYTLEQYDTHPEIDGIVVICVEDWIDYLRKLLRKFAIEKVRAIVPGGATGQASIFNGLKAAEQCFPGDTIVLMHDGVRPIIDADTISRNIACAKENGNAITVAPAIETIALRGDGDDAQIEDIIDRSHCALAKAPQSFVLSQLLAAHRQAVEEGYLDAIDSACLMRHFGHALFTVQGSSDNIKITTPADFYMFRAIMEAKENSQIFG